MKKLFIILIIGLVFSGCKKDEPDPKAPNTFVQSINVTVKYSDWELYTGDDYHGYEVGVEMPEITDKIISDGAILVYMIDEEFLLSLPYTFVHGGDAISFYSAFTVGYFSPAIYYNWPFEEDDAPPSVDYKVVLIEGVPPASLKTTDYQEVKKFYNLTD